MPVLAVGAAFDFHAGLLAQAPAWMQGVGDWSGCSGFILDSGVSGGDMYY